MSKYILIDLEDTITIHKDKERVKSVMIRWLKNNGIKDAENIYNNPNFKNRESRLKLLKITKKEYEKWYENFKEAEFEEYYEKFKLGEIKIEKSAIDFIKKNKNILILVSNSAPKWIDFILEKYGIKKYFKYIFYREYKINDVKKPSKEVIKIIENDINDNIDNSSIVIGDSYTDYLFAKNCNLKFVCMYNKIENCNIYKDFNEVDELIKENIE